MKKVYIDKLAWICIVDKKILVTMSKGNDTWYIPGGKREPGESDIDALTREVKEELHVDLEKNSIHYYGTFEAQAHGKEEGVNVRMTCYQGNYIGVLQSSNEIEKFDYLSYKDKNIQKNFPG